MDGTLFGELRMNDVQWAKYFEAQEEMKSALLERILLELSVAEIVECICESSICFEIAVKLQKKLTPAVINRNMNNATEK